MTRLLFFACSILMVANTSAQQLFMETLPAKDGQVYYEAVNEVPGVSKDELYERIKKFASYNIRNSQSAIDYENKENGEIILKFLFHIKWNSDFTHVEDVTVRPLCHFKVKDGKYKVTCKDFRVSYILKCLNCNKDHQEYLIENWDKGTKNSRIKAFQQIAQEMAVLMGTIKKEIQTPPDNDNW